MGKDDGGVRRVPSAAPTPLRLESQILLSLLTLSPFHPKLQFCGLQIISVRVSLLDHVQSMISAVSESPEPIVAQ